MNNLPVLYTLPKWKLVRGLGKNKIEYYVPWLDKWINNKRLNARLSEIRYDAQTYYDRWFLNITTPSQRPRCQVLGCTNEAIFQGIDRNYCRLTCNNPEHDKIAKGMNHARGNKNRFNDPIIRERLSKAYSIGSRKSWSNPTERMKENCGKYRSIKESVFSQYENKIIILDSWWEVKFFNDCINNPSIKSVLREPITIKYIKPTDGEWHSYFPDFLVEYNNGKKELIEIKPNYLLTDPIVKAKESYSIKYCSENNLSYKFITEDHLF